MPTKKTINKKSGSKKTKVKVFERDEHKVRFIEAPAREKKQGPGGVVMPLDVQVWNTIKSNTIESRIIEWVACTGVSRSALQAFRPMGRCYSGRS